MFWVWWFSTWQNSLLVLPGDTGGVRTLIALHRGRRMWITKVSTSSSCFVKISEYSWLCQSSGNCPRSFLPKVWYQLSSSRKYVLVLKPVSNSTFWKTIDIRKVRIYFLMESNSVLKLFAAPLLTGPRLAEFSPRYTSIRVWQIPFENEDLL